MRQPQEQGRGCRLLHFIPDTADASSVPLSPQALRAELREAGASRAEAAGCPAVADPARQGPSDAQLPRLADGAELTPARATSPLPTGLTLPLLLPQHGRQRAPHPSSTRDGMGMQALPGLLPPFPLLPPAQRSPGPQHEAQSCSATGGHPPGAALPATLQPCRHLPARWAGARHSPCLG